MREEVELAPAISYQNDYETEGFDIDVNANEVEANDNNLALAEDQYPTPDPSVLKAFLVNLVGLSVENSSLFESNGVDCSHKKLFIATTAKKEPKYCSLEPAVMIQLEKQQNDRFYDYNQCQIPFKLQTAFVVGIYQQNIPPKIANYRCLKEHPFEKKFC